MYFQRLKIHILESNAVKKTRAFTFLLVISFRWQVFFIKYVYVSFHKTDHLTSTGIYHANPVLVSDLQTLSTESLWSALTTFWVWNTDIYVWSDVFSYRYEEIIIRLQQKMILNRSLWSPINSLPSIWFSLSISASLSNSGQCKLH